jgi:ABC-type multidrug transport system fused ATPase/permease subunit
LKGWLSLALFCCLLVGWLFFAAFLPGGHFLDHDRAVGKYPSTSGRAAGAINWEPLPMIAAIPLLILPFILYNLGMVGLLGSGGVAVFESTVLSMTMLSGAVWTMSVGDLVIVIALVLLFVEILKATRVSSKALMDHLLSMVLFIVFLVEFLLVANAATHTFFILMTISFIDVIAGFSVSMRTAGRDVSIGL